MRSASLRREAMGERGRSLMQRPAAEVRPQGRQLAAAEAGAHARRCIVPADMVAPKDPDQPAAEERKCRPARLESDEKRGERGRSRENLRKLRRLEVMQEKISDDDVGRRRRRKISEHVLRNLLLPPTELTYLRARRRGHDRLLIDKDGGDTGPMPRKTPGEPKHQTPVARAKLDDPFRRNRREAAQTPGHDGGMQHHRMEELEVAA